MDSILVTGFFRTGSTLLFSALRQCEDFKVFYEPYHPEILKYVEACQAGLASVDQHKLGHTIDEDYFEEYADIDLGEMKRVLELGPRTLNHPVLSSQCDAEHLKAYVKFLHFHAEATGKIPVLQANRFNFCIDWFKNNFPRNYNILITRNAYDIFCSLKKLARSDGIDLTPDCSGIDYWNVLSIFDSLRARHPFVDCLHSGYFYKLCFVVEWINRIESNKADLIIPFEALGNEKVVCAALSALSTFAIPSNFVRDYLETNFRGVQKPDPSVDFVDISKLVGDQISVVCSEVFHKGSDGVVLNV